VLNPKIVYHSLFDRYYQSLYKEAYDDYNIANQLNPENLEVQEMLAQFESVESSKVKTAVHQSGAVLMDVIYLTVRYHNFTLCIITIKFYI
jgi:hypothetical protein